MSGEQNHGTATAERNRSDVVGDRVVQESDGRLIELQRKHNSEYLTLIQALDQPTQRKILHALVNGLGDASYREIEAITTVGKRAIRKHIRRLEDEGIVERIDAQTYIIAFGSYEIRALAQHALHLHEQQLHD